MPTYEYECKDCRHTFEAFQSMKDDPLSTCPQCGGTVRRLLSGGAGVIFKGQGFYVTDKGKSASSGVSKPEAAKDGTTATATSKTESAPSCTTCPAAASGTPCAAQAAKADAKHVS
jgi:putative FmdB family regulatory protein